MVQISLRIVQVDGKKRAQGLPLSDLQKGILGRVPSIGRLLSDSGASSALPGGALSVGFAESLPGGESRVAPGSSQQTASGGAPLSPPDMPEATA